MNKRTYRKAFRYSSDLGRERSLENIIEDRPRDVTRDMWVRGLRIDWVRPRWVSGNFDPISDLSRVTLVEYNVNGTSLATNNKYNNNNNNKIILDTLLEIIFDTSFPKQLDLFLEKEMPTLIEEFQEQWRDLSPPFKGTLL